MPAPASASASASACGSTSSFNINETNSKIITPLAYQSTHSKITPSSFGYNLVGTCNGLICLANETFFSPSFPTIIWNPSVTKFVTPHPTVTIPENSIDNTHDCIRPTYAFGYDSWTNDYKVLTIFSNQRSTGPAVDTPFAVQVYSLARGSWKTLSPSPPTVSIPGSDLLHITVHRKSVFNGAVHWFLCHDLNYRELGIVSFDMATESFSHIELPKPLRKTTDSLVLSVHEDSLALIKFFQHRYSRSRVITYCYLKLWVMQQYGAVKSWTELHGVTLPKPVSSVYHVGIISNGEQVFKSTKDSRLVMVDFKTKQVRYSGVGEGRNYESMDSFVESLALLDQSNSCSYQVAGTNKQTNKPGGL